MLKLVVAMSLSDASEVKKVDARQESSHQEETEAMLETAPTRTPQASLLSVACALFFRNLQHLRGQFSGSYAFCSLLILLLVAWLHCEFLNPTFESELTVQVPS
jgi:hypothetical protein